LATYGKNSTLQTAILWEICHALKHNFFADIAVQLPPTYTTQAPADSTQDDRIAALEQEIALLKAKNESLMEALKGK
jgi:restriction endonuclease S subunit